MLVREDPYIQTPNDTRKGASKKNGKLLRESWVKERR
jgi:hypothetical protein